MREAVIVSTTCTPIGKAFGGAFNETQGPVLAAHAIRAATGRAGLEGGEIGDSTMGCALTAWRERHQPRAPRGLCRRPARRGAGRDHRPAMHLGSVSQRRRARGRALRRRDRAGRGGRAREGQEERRGAVTLARDEYNRCGTSADGLAPVMGEGSTVTAGNSSQLSDGASAAVLMSAATAASRGLTPLRIFRGMSVVGCAPEEMGIGPALAIPALIERHGPGPDDIDLFEISEAFAARLVHCRDRLRLDPERLKVNGGAISVGHPYGMSGARMVGLALLEGRRRRARLAVTGMCVGWGMGAAALLEIA